MFLCFSKVWDGVSGDELITLAHKHIVKSVDFSEVLQNLSFSNIESVLYENNFMMMDTKSFLKIRKTLEVAWVVLI